jgi:hypothetical protein
MHMMEANKKNPRQETVGRLCQIATHKCTPKLRQCQGEGHSVTDPTIRPSHKDGCRHSPAFGWCLIFLKDQVRLETRAGLALHEPEILVA